MTLVAVGKEEAGGDQRILPLSRGGKPSEVTQVLIGHRSTLLESS